MASKRRRAKAKPKKAATRKAVKRKARPKKKAAPKRLMDTVIGFTPTADDPLTRRRMSGHACSFGPGES